MHHTTLHCTLPTRTVCPMLKRSQATNQHEGEASLKEEKNLECLFSRFHTQGASFHKLLTYNGSFVIMQPTQKLKSLCKSNLTEICPMMC